MKFPSIDYLSSQLTQSFKRFYLPILFAIAGTWTAIFMIDNEDNKTQLRILCSCILGISFSVGCMLFAEKSGKKAVKLSAPFFAVLCIAAYWYWVSPFVFFDDVQGT